MKLSILALLLPTLFAGTVHAQLKITEVESSEAGGLHQDWWELTNFGNEAVSLDGYKFDDGSAAIASGVALGSSLAIQPGESIVFVETMTAQEFRTWWGNLLPASAKVMTYTGSGLGLSSGGDSVNVWDANGVLVDSVKFGAAQAGVSFGYDLGSKTFGGLSVVGVGGAFVATDNGDIGSPAAVPEPSGVLLAGVGLALHALRSRASRRKVG